jgi:hypothetical protein
MQVNDIILEGTVASEVVCDYDSFDHEIYKFQILVRRKSGAFDVLNCVSRNAKELKKGDRIRVYGYIRSRNEICGNKRHCHIYVFCKRYEKPEEELETNLVQIKGNISKIGTLRNTPSGRIYIIDFTVKVYDSIGVHYIPAIAWRKTAEMISGMKKWDEISFLGRFQSREYEKRLEDGTIEVRTAYEVSCNNILGDVKNETVKYES